MLQGILFSYFIVFQLEIDTAMLFLPHQKARIPSYFEPL